jgi:hypothetical protein
MTVRPGTSRGKALRLACWNADGVRSRKLVLEQFLSEHGVDTCLLNEMHLEKTRAVTFENCLPPDGLTDSGRRHGNTYPQGHRSPRGASPGSAAPGSYRHTLSAGDRTSEARVGLPLAHRALDRVGPDRMSERGISRLNGGAISTRCTGTGILG